MNQFSDFKSEIQKNWLNRRKSNKVTLIFSTLAVNARKMTYLNKDLKISIIENPPISNIFESSGFKLDHFFPIQSILSKIGKVNDNKMLRSKKAESIYGKTQWLAFIKLKCFHECRKPEKQMNFESRFKWFCLIRSIPLKRAR